MSPLPAGDDLEALAISRLDGEIDDQRWAQLLEQHQAPLGEALLEQQRIAQALRSLPRVGADAVLTRSILETIPWRSGAPSLSAAAAPPAAPSPRRRWHPVRWASAAALAASLVLAWHLESRMETPAGTLVATRSGAALPQHPAAVVQEYGSASEAEAAGESARGEAALGSAGQPVAASRTQPPLTDENTVARQELARPESGPGSMPPPPAGDAAPPASAPPASAPAGSASPPSVGAPGADAISPAASVASEPAPRSSAAAPAAPAVPSADAATTPNGPRIAAAADADQDDTIPRSALDKPIAATKERSTPGAPAGGTWSVHIAFAPTVLPTLQLSVGQRGEARTLAAESLSVVGCDPQGRRVWSAPLHLPPQEVAVDGQHPYRAQVSLSGDLQVPAGVASVGIASSYAHSPLLRLPSPDATGDAPAKNAPAPAAAPEVAPAAASPGH
jgi:hypothetical protein